MGWVSDVGTACLPPHWAPRTRQRSRDGPAMLGGMAQSSPHCWQERKGVSIQRRGLEPPTWGRPRYLPYPEPSPGHALEAGWFLLRYAIQRGDAKLRAHVIDKFLLLPFHSGWDPEHGGLFYFQDADGLCPTQVGMCPGLSLNHFTECGAQGDPSGPQAHVHKETHVPPSWKSSLDDSKPSALRADLCVIITSV